MSACFIGCDKYKDSGDDLSGELYFRGRAFVANDRFNNEIKALSGKTIRVGYAIDSTINYLFTTTSDSDGYFLFENLKKDQPYIFFGEYEEDGTKLTGRLDTVFSASVDSSRLIFRLSNQQNGVIYTVSDVSGGYVNNANVCFFTSGVGANEDCLNHSYQTTSNTYGKASIFNIPPSTYHVFFKAKFGTLTLKATDVITIGTTGIIRKNIVVQ